MMASYNLDLLGYTKEQIEEIEKILLEYYSEDEVVEFVSNGEFVLYENCHTLEDIIRYRELEYGDCSKTVQEIDISNIWLDTKYGIILMS